MRALRVTAVLEHSEPPIWRRLELSSDLRLDELHRVLQAAFDWEGHHLHEFRAAARRWDDERAEPERKTRLGQVLVGIGDQLGYTYDFGDGWEHAITLDGIGEPDDGAPRARVIDAERAAPPEDCGGVFGYEELVTALADPDNPEHAHLVEWYEEMYGDPASFDPEYVDVASLARSVRRVVS